MAEIFDLSAAELAQIEGGGWNVLTNNPTETFSLNFSQITV
jgi:hypothetical protein